MNVALSPSPTVMWRWWRFYRPIYPPVRYKGGVDRIGPRKGIANEQEERILTERRVALARSFDARPCPESTIEDLALGHSPAYRHEAIDSETIAANQRSIEQQLGSLHFFNPERK